MKQDELSYTERILKDVPSGEVSIVRHFDSAQGRTLLTDQFLAKTSGKGKVETYALFPGIEASYHVFLAPQIAFHHDASDSMLEIFHCRSGRIGWNMRGGTAVYLGAGDMTVHSTACCADSAMMFPLGYTAGISFSVDLPHLNENPPEILREAGIDGKRLQDLFCSGKPVATPACAELDCIFAPLYCAAPAQRRPYLKLKIQELLLFLCNFQPERRELTQYHSQQTELIKETHRLLTEHLDQRYTIEDLSKRFLINSSMLKEVFKAVYGAPIATYMKEYRIRQAMKLLRDTNDSIASIAARVGYESQGKFTQAFKDVAMVLPSEYRKFNRENELQ